MAQKPPQTLRCCPNITPLHPPQCPRCSLSLTALPGTVLQALAPLSSTRSHVLRTVVSYAQACPMPSRVLRPVVSYAPLLAGPVPVPLTVLEVNEEKAENCRGETRLSFSLQRPILPIIREHRVIAHGYMRRCTCTYLCVCLYTRCAVY